MQALRLRPEWLPPKSPTVHPVPRVWYFRLHRLPLDPAVQTSAPSPTCSVDSAANDCSIGARAALDDLVRCALGVRVPDRSGSSDPDIIFGLCRPRVSHRSGRRQASPNSQMGDTPLDTALPAPRRDRILPHIWLLIGKDLLDLILRLITPPPPRAPSSSLPPPLHPRSTPPQPQPPAARPNSSSSGTPPASRADRQSSSSVWLF